MQSLRDKTIVITGASAGIGRETAAVLASRGARVVLACRDIDKAERARRAIAARHPDAKTEALACDLASFESIRRFSERFQREYRRLDVLINNAGVSATRLAFTEDGFEMDIGVNHLGHFLLTHLLLGHLQASAPSRIVTVASAMHRYARIDLDSFRGPENFSALAAYAQSKLANLLFNRELARRLEGTGVSANACHPGLVRTQIARQYSLFTRLWFIVFARSPRRGATASIHLAASPGLERQSGSYFVGCRPAVASPRARDPVMAARLWGESAKFVGLARACRSRGRAPNANTRFEDQSHE